MSNQYWSWLLGIVGVVGFILAGRKVWWSWYVNLGCQVLWFIYAIVTKQWGFIATALVYTWVFGQNAYKWTREHRAKKDDYVTVSRGMQKATEDKVLCGNGIVTDIHEDDKGMTPWGISRSEYVAYDFNGPEPVYEYGLTDEEEVEYWLKTYPEDIVSRRWET